MNLRFVLTMFVLLSLILLSGCNTGGNVVCNKPYIRVGNDCCLDQNDNSICDKDEISAEIEQADSEVSSEEKEEVTVESDLYKNPFALTIGLEDLEDGFKINERYSLNFRRIQADFNRLSNYKLNSLGFETGYSIEFLKESYPKKSIWQYVVILDSEENAQEFFEDRYDYYKEFYDIESFDYDFDFDKLTLFVSLGSLDGNYYRFLIRIKNAVIGLTILTQPGKLLDNAEFLDMLEGISFRAENYDENISLPEEIMLPRKITFGSSPYPFPPDIITKRMNGVTAGLLNYSFEKKGDDWGKLKSIIIVIDNEKGTGFYPYVNIISYDASLGRITEMPSTKIEVGEWLDTGEYMIADLDVDLSVSKIRNEKTLRLAVEDYSGNIVNFEVPVTFYIEKE